MIPLPTFALPGPFAGKCSFVDCVWGSGKSMAALGQCNGKTVLAQRGLHLGLHNQIFGAKSSFHVTPGELRSVCNSVWVGQGKDRRRRNCQV